MKRRRLLELLCGLICAVLVHLPFDTQAVGNVYASQRVDGTAVGIGGRMGNRTRLFRLVANSYSTPEQITALNDAWRGGQAEFLRVLTGMNVGRVEIGTGLGVRANAIIASDWGDGGKKLTVFYERRISFFEVRYATRLQDYPIGYAELYLDKNGRGQGTLVLAARVRLNDGVWDVEGFGVFPARLIGLRSRGSVGPA